MRAHYRSPWFILGAILVLSVAIPVNGKKFGDIGKHEDIYYIFLESKRITEGENPYARVLEGNMRDNNKYATYFPLFYYLGSVVILCGGDDYIEYLQFWQVIYLIVLAAIGFLIYHILARRGYRWLAVFGALFFLFNRWTIYVSRAGQMDFLALFPLILSIYYLRKDFVKSLILFGISLSIKQIAIFMSPLYLVWAWQLYKDRKWLWKSALYAGAIPFLVSLPFLIWNFKGFIYSVFFSATRHAATHVNAKSMDASVGMVGIVAKLPMLTIMTLIFILAYKQKIGPMLATLFIFAAFIDFNSVLFNQYFVWMVPFIPLLITDFKENSIRFYEAT